MTDDKPHPFSGRLSAEEREKIVSELELVDFQATLALNRSLDDYKLLSDIAALVRERKGIEPKPALKSGEFRVIVRDAPIPSFHALQDQFDWVSGDFATARFESVDACWEISHATREAVMRYHTGHDPAMNDVQLLEHMDVSGVMPILPEWLIEFARAYPEEQRRAPIAALGAFAFVSGNRAVAVLNDDREGRNLNFGLLTNIGTYSSSCRYLVIDK